MPYYFSDRNLFGKHVVIGKSSEKVVKQQWARAAYNKHSFYEALFSPVGFKKFHTQLMYNFENFTKLSLVLKNDHAAIKENGK